MDKHSENKAQNKKLPITDIKVDTSIVARRSLLPLIKGYNQKRAVPSWHEPQQTTYPLASIYYALNADTDPTQRIADFIENSAVRPPPHFKPPTHFCDPYSEEEARIRYLESKPVCYIVFGKPGLEIERLAESIAIERNCVFISASKILRDIEENGDLRKRNEFECGCGDSKEDIVWDVIVDRVGKRDVLHKGYVIEGLPVITRNCKSASVVSESTESKKSLESVGTTDNYLLINLQTESTISDETTASSELSTSLKSFCSTLSNNNNTESLDISTLASESSVKSSKTCACSVQASIDTKCSSIRLEEIFNNWYLKPDVVIHVTCPDDEILEKYNVRDSNSASSFEELESDSLSELTDMLSNKLGSNANSETQFGYSSERLIDELRDYDEKSAKIIEKLISLHNPQNVIRIDGRYSFDHCFQSIKIRLELLPLQVVITARRMPESTTNFGSDESESESEDYENESFENFEEVNLNLKRVFDDIKRSGIPSDKFQWKLSRWKFLCPVELAKGRKIEGKKKLAARFMNWLFFLSSNEAMEAFIENPRPYLLPPNPRPYCRIAVIGSRYSGKTRLCFDLAMNLDSVVINLRDIIAGLSRASESYSFFNANSSFDVSELVSAIVECTENLPDQDCGDFSRNRGWILDGLPLDFELCKKLLENDVHIDSIVVLFESQPYSKSMANFLKMQDESSEQSVSEEICENDMEETSQNYSGKLFSLSNYEEQLKYFEDNRKLFAKKLSHIGVDVILCDLQKIDDVSDHIVSQVRKDYQFTIGPLEEKEDDYSDDDEEESSTESKGTASSLNNQREKTLHLGDCNVFCPIALLEHKVLWKGKEKYRCLLDDKLFLVSSESSLDNFINDYSKLQLPLSKPLSQIPPLRIFIVGPPGSGISTLAKSISKEYGLAHIDFHKQLDKYASSRGIDVEHLKSRYANQYEEEDSFEEVESPENLDDSKYNIDKPTISSFFIKYKKEGTALPHVVANECILNFFKPPFDQCGIVVDSFPNCIEDCEMMLKKFAIPDIIIELECSFVDSAERSLKSMMAEWRIEQETKRNEEETRFSERMRNYLDEKDDWTRQEKLKIYKERKLHSEEHESSVSENLSADLPAESLSFSYVSDFTSVITTEDEIEIEETFYKLYPEPEPLDDWESEESAKEKFAMQIEVDYEKSSENLILMLNFFKDENIPWIKVDASPETKKVSLITSLVLSPYIQRNNSLLEITHELDNATAENLLSIGYFFLSSFGRFCPIQAFNGTNPFQMFPPLASTGRIFTVLHRQYVYFLAGEAALSEFRKDPLKYLSQDSQRPLIPALISITGPPKCGKSTLAKRFASTYSFETVSRDEAINYVLDNFPATKLSGSIRKNLQNGDTATPCQLAEVIKLFLSNPKCLTQGCVFDGFPASVEETRALASLAVIPLVNVDLEASFDFTFECMERDSSYVYTSPSHFQNFETWKADAQEYRSWLSHQYGNVVKVDATRSKAAVWRRADEHVRYGFGKFFNYIREAGYDKVHDLESLCVTPREIQTRTSRFQLYCPGCIFFDKTFRSPDNISKSRRGLLQFREFFYWFCDVHSATFAQDPNRHIRLFEKLELPDTYPEILKHDVVDLDDSYWSSRLVNGGYCLVTYASQLPARKLIRGKPCLAVLYKDRLQLFCSEACRGKFCAGFPVYSTLEINFTRTLEHQVKNLMLPTRGFIEQTLAEPVAKAVNRVGELRPKLPGMSSRDTAAVFIGAYLKAYRKEEDYNEELRRIEARCQIFREVTVAVKKRINPWVVQMVGQGDEKLVRIDDFEENEALVEVDNRFEFSTVKFRRTSPTQLIIDTDESSD